MSPPLQRRQDLMTNVVVGGGPTGVELAGAHVAKLIARELTDGPRETAQRAAFAYRHKGNMATIGRSHAIAEIGRLHLIAWLAWLALHLFFLIGFRNRSSVLLQWTCAYFSYKRGARIISGMEVSAPPPPK